VDRTLRFIGEVRSGVKDRKTMPPLGAPAAVELYEAFAPGLLRIEKHSHMWVMAWLMGRPERDVLQVTPRGVPPDAPDAKHGVFAVRSPARPNPIGLSSARLLRVEGLTLHFDRLDFFDGTPVVDLKPYFAARDLIFSAHNTSIGRPKDVGSLRESLVEQALRFSPEKHADVALAVRMMEHYRVEVAGWKEPERWEITAPLGRPHLVDALMGMARVSLSRGMRVGNEDKVVMQGVEYSPAGAGMSYEERLAAATEEVFTFRPGDSEGAFAAAEERRCPEL